MARYLIDSTNQKRSDGLALILRTCLGCVGMKLRNGDADHQIIL